MRFCCRGGIVKEEERKGVRNLLPDGVGLKADR